MLVILVGAGIRGLGTALLLARDGHHVTVLEADRDPLPGSPEEAWTRWARKGVAQFRLPHNFMPGLRLLLEAELPDAQDALRRAGASRYDLQNPIPRFFNDQSPRPVDEQLWTYTTRRPVEEWVFASLADGQPVATGLVAVADAWACTNPSAGRGLTVGFLHALRLRNVLRETASNPRHFAEEFDRCTESEIAPWYCAQIAVDGARFADMDALGEGRAPGPAADPLARQLQQLFASIPADPDLFRAALEYVGTITTAQDILQRPEVIERLAAAQDRMKAMPPMQMPGPNRQQLLALVA